MSEEVGRTLEKADPPAWHAGHTSMSMFTLEDIIVCKPDFSPELRFTKNASNELPPTGNSQSLPLIYDRKPCIARETTMAGMEQLEIHSKVRRD